MPYVGVTGGSEWLLELSGESELECFERARVRKRIGDPSEGCG